MPDRNLLSLRRRGFLVGALAGAAAWLAACDEKSSSAQNTPLIEGRGANAKPSAEPEGRRRVALVMKTLTNPFFVEMEKGARRAEAELGIALLVRTAAQETSIEQQIAVVDELVRQKVDAIVIAPGDSVKLLPVLQKAHQAGIAIVNIDNRLDPEFAAKLNLADVPFVSVDNEQGAYLAAGVIAREADRPTRAAVIEGIRTAANAEARRRGALRAFAENPNVEVAVQETANWKIDEGYAVAKRIFEDDPGIRLLFCANDMMALGAIRYLEEAKRADVRVAGFDALEESRPALRSRQLAVTVDQQAAAQGYLGVAHAVRLLNRQPVPATTLVDVRLVTAADLRP